MTKRELHDSLKDRSSATLRRLLYRWYDNLIQPPEERAKPLPKGVKKNQMRKAILRVLGDRR